MTELHANECILFSGREMDASVAESIAISEEAGILSNQHNSVAHRDHKNRNRQRLANQASQKRQAVEGELDQLDQQLREANTLLKELKEKKKLAKVTGGIKKCRSPEKARKGKDRMVVDTSVRHPCLMPMDRKGAGSNTTLYL